VLAVKPGGTADEWHTLAPACSPSTGGVPSSRWGASRWVASALDLWTATLAKNRPTGEGPTARRVARGAAIRQSHGYDARPVARRAWVQALGCARPWASARANLQEEYTTARRPASRSSKAAHDATSKAGASGASTARSWPRRAGVRPAWTHALIHDSEGKTTARRPVFQSPGLGASPPRGTAARRGVSPRPGELGCGVTPTPGAPDRAAWGSHGAGPPLINTAQRRDHVRSSHGDGGAQGHERPRSSIRRGTAVLRLDGQHPGKE
jgi:hypothetical protein